jgi:Na+/H+ antiporter NhaC
VFMTGVLYSAEGAISWWWAPYYFFGILSPLVLFAMAFFGYGYTQDRSEADQAVVADD